MIDLGFFFYQKALSQVLVAKYCIKESRNISFFTQKYTPIKIMNICCINVSELGSR